MSQTLIEKIAQRFAVGLDSTAEIHAGDYLSIKPAHVMTHDNTAAVIPKFKAMGATKVADPRQPVFGLDHDIQNTSDDNLAKYAKIQAFAAEQGVDFYPAGRGIVHQLMLEEGYVLPGAFVVGSDSHSNIYGALGALGTPVVRTDAAAIWATGRTWWQVPPIVKVVLTGALQPGVVGKDVIIALCGIFNNDEVLNCCLEFAGTGVAALSIEERMTISNMTTEWGALAGVFPFDAKTRDYLHSRAEQQRVRSDESPRLTPESIERMAADVPTADADASYAKTLELDLSAVTPFISGPNTVKTITPLPEMESQGVKIDRAYLVGCVNARLQDFEAAAAVIAGHKVAEHVKFYIAAASDEVEQQARSKGYWRTLVEAGAIEQSPGCGACIGLGDGTLEAGEVGISATNRNFKGRMGSRDAAVYLSSPAVVAASAVAGKIAGPEFLHRLQTGATESSEHRLEAGATPAGHPDGAQRLKDLAAGAKVQAAQTATRPAAKVSILPGFPDQMTGELLLIPADNLNTDGIYGKDYTYKELPAEEMARVAMENYDPEFQQIAREGDILLGGYNFGTGSSREQAATALKYRGVQMIIAGSFSQTYKRNAFNNGYVCIECPELVDDLRAAFKDDKRLTIRGGREAVVSFADSSIQFGGKTYAFAALGEVAQELVVKGGFEAVIADLLKG